MFSFYYIFYQLLFGQLTLWRQYMLSNGLKFFGVFTVKKPFETPPHKNQCKQKLNYYNWQTKNATDLCFGMLSI